MDLEIGPGGRHWFRTKTHLGQNFEPLTPHPVRWPQVPASPRLLWNPPPPLVPVSAHRTAEALTQLWVLGGVQWQMLRTTDG